ncbi:arrestin domain-containing protein [Pochonia chlamydosporia 170]|uniref:Arrestin domain-containing protein n=1 Tax=Pochonia chlamydosporia 170 TaxID=1380566 RepID=A0A179F2S7_METCM|nr:arrestin domain-containing protein [Pochonia chlamydosporia 170]OAQ59737.2 arrestin domain-containing protein [Pochonia chlamydosporia 170]
MISLVGRSLSSCVMLNSDTVVFRGNADESAGQVLTGVIVLSLQSARLIDHQVRLRLLAILEVANDTATIRQRLRECFLSNKTRTTEIVLEHLGSRQLHSNPLSSAGHYRYPFELSLPSDLAESVQGVPEVSLKYRVDATILSQGRPILYARKALRIIRTPALDALEPLQGVVGESILADRLRHDVSIFPKAVSFGGNIQLKLRACPLVTGLKLRDIKARVVEIREFLTQENRSKEVRKCIAEVLKTALGQKAKRRDMELGSDRDDWALSIELSLPRRIGDCIPDLSHSRMRAHHRVETIFAVIDLDGKVFKICTTIPITVYMPLDATFNADGVILTPRMAARSTQPASSIAPPVY